MNTLKNLLTTLMMNPGANDGRRMSMWNKIILPASERFEGPNPNRTGIFMQATFFKEGKTPCDTRCVQFGAIHPKNVFFAGEKVWRLWENPSDEFASQSADPLRDSYTGLEWAELRTIKFGGAVRIRHEDSGDRAILAVSGLHPHVDEAVGFSFAHMCRESDGLVIAPCSNNPALKGTLALFGANMDLFLQ